MATVLFSILTKYHLPEDVARQIFLTLIKVDTKGNFLRALSVVNRGTYHYFSSDHFIALLFGSVNTHGMFQIIFDALILRSDKILVMLGGLEPAQHNLPVRDKVILKCFVYQALLIIHTFPFPTLDKDNELYRKTIETALEQIHQDTFKEFTRFRIAQQSQLVAVDSSIASELILKFAQELSSDELSGDDAFLLLDKYKEIFSQPKYFSALVYEWQRHASFNYNRDVIRNFLLTHFLGERSCPFLAKFIILNIIAYNDISCDTFSLSNSVFLHCRCHGIYGHITKIKQYLLPDLLMEECGPITILLLSAAITLVLSMSIA